MTDWLPTNELASRFGLDSFELLDALAKLGLAAGPRPTPLAETHGFSSSGLNDAGRMEALWHPDVCRLLQGVGLMLLPIGSRFDQGFLFESEQVPLFEEDGEPGAQEEDGTTFLPSPLPEGTTGYGPTACEAGGQPLREMRSHAVPVAMANTNPNGASLSSGTSAETAWERANASGSSASSISSSPRSSSNSSSGSSRIVAGSGPVGKIRPGFERIVATDGACSGNPGPGGWAWVEQKSGARESGGAARTTNNIMELTALIKALEFVGPEPSLLIRCDSQYVINTMTKWAPTWRRKGWKKADGQPVKNRELVERLLSLYEGRTGKTEVEWVKGHAGDAANELCDKLAVAESKKHAR